MFVNPDDDCRIIFKAVYLSESNRNLSVRDTTVLRFDVGGSKTRSRRWENYSVDMIEAKPFTKYLSAFCRQARLEVSHSQKCQY